MINFSDMYERQGRCPGCDGGALAGNGRCWKGHGLGVNLHLTSDERNARRFSVPVYVELAAATASFRCGRPRSFKLCFPLMKTKMTIQLLTLSSILG
jgi:hypothetical protein